ncbi:MAG: hypothetical protein ACLS9G_00030 [Akkermansia sp.]
MAGGKRHEKHAGKAEVEAVYFNAAQGDAEEDDSEKDQGVVVEQDINIRRLAVLFPSWRRAGNAVTDENACVRKRRARHISSSASSFSAGNQPEWPDPGGAAKAYGRCPLSKEPGQQFAGGNKNGRIRAFQIVVNVCVIDGLDSVRMGGCPVSGFARPGETVFGDASKQLYS